MHMVAGPSHRKGEMTSLPQGFTEIRVYPGTPMSCYKCIAVFHGKDYMEIDA